MSYTETFGGATLYPSGQTYLSLIFSTNVTLAWPVEQQIGGDVVADIMDLNATATSLNVDLPSARQVSNGVQSVFNNVGTNTVTVRDNAGGTIISVEPGAAWVAYLTDNTTDAGSWRTFQLGATVAAANASALAGSGIKAVSTTLNQSIPPETRTTTPVSIVEADRAKALIYTGGAGVGDLPTPATVGSDWFVMVRNSGTGNLTLTPPAGQIDGNATLALAPNQSLIVLTDGTNFFSIGLSQSTASVFDFVTIAVPGSGDFTLSGVNLNRIAYRFTGILTGNRNIIVPNTIQQYWVENATTGSFELRVKTAAQSPGIQILAGDRAILYSDATNVVNANSSTVTFPISITQGGTGGITAATGLANLGGVPLTRQINAGEGLAGGGDLTANRTLSVDTTDSTFVTAMGDALVTDTSFLTGVATDSDFLNSLGPQLFSECRAAMQFANQLISNNVITTLIFDGGEEFDDNGWHDQVTNPERLTVPAGVTRAQFIAFFIIDPSSPVPVSTSLGFSAGITKNGALFNAANSFSFWQDPTQPGAIRRSQGCLLDSGPVSVVAGDFFEVKVLQNAGSGNTYSLEGSFSSQGFFGVRGWRRTL